MKKIIIILAIIVFIAIIAFFAYSFLKPTPKLSDNAKEAWITVCADNQQCVQGVNKHYLGCAQSVSFEKPTNKDDLAEYIALTKMELEACLTDKIGSSFPVN